MSEITWLPPDERIKFYRELNRQSLLKAERFRGTLRLAFMLSAERWESLANATENAVREHERVATKGARLTRLA